ncbi:MAG: hypothetical protein Q9218_002550 [Villophora microphyllina]
MTELMTNHYITPLFIAWICLMALARSLVTLYCLASGNPSLRPWLHTLDVLYYIVTWGTRIVTIACATSIPLYFFWPPKSTESPTLRHHTNTDSDQLFHDEVSRLQAIEPFGRTAKPEVFKQANRLQDPIRASMFGERAKKGRKAQRKADKAKWAREEIAAGLRGILLPAGQDRISPTQAFMQADASTAPTPDAGNALDTADTAGNDIPQAG